MDKYQTIQVIINTLDTISVKGKENLGALLGSIQTLNQLSESLKKEDAEHEDNLLKYRNEIHKFKHPADNETTEEDSTL